MVHARDRKCAPTLDVATAEYSGQLALHALHSLHSEKLPFTGLAEHVTLLLSQSPLSVRAPHGAPPNRGSAMQERVRVCVPTPPQLTEQADQADHADVRPSTGGRVTLQYGPVKGDVGKHTHLPCTHWPLTVQLTPVHGLLASDKTWRWASGKIGDSRAHARKPCWKWH